MKFYESLSTLALALADLAQSVRVYVQYITRQPVPMPKTTIKSKSTTLHQIDDEVLWQQEQDQHLASLRIQTQHELDLHEQELQRAEVEAQNEAKRVEEQKVQTALGKTK